MACSYWIAAACSAAIALTGCVKSRPLLPDLGTVPGFTLINQSGREFQSNSTLSGKVWVGDFIFTHCPGPCPRMSSRMRKLEDALPAENFRLVSFTVDPARDTPPVLAEYAKHFDAGPNWYFLTGPSQTLGQLARQTFKLFDMTTELEHSTAFVLVDKSSHLRGYYPSDSNEKLDQLIVDCKTLLRDK